MRDVDDRNSSSPCPAESIKLLVAFATEKGMKLSHWDVKQAYIHAKLKVDMNMAIATCADDLLVAGSEEEYG